MYRVQAFKAITNLIPTLIPTVPRSPGSRYTLLVCLFLGQSLVSSPSRRYFQIKYSINHRRTFRMDPGFSVQQHQMNKVNPFCRRPTCFGGAQALYLLSTGYKPLYAGSMFLNELIALNKGILVLDACTAIFSVVIIYFQIQASSSPCSGFSIVTCYFQKTGTIYAV